MSDEGYNGWKNYPTWCVNLWLSNDEGLYSATRELVDSVETVAKRSEWGDAHRVRVADAICDFVEGLGATVDSGHTYPVSGEPVGFTADLLGYALSCVDWLEIADAWLSE